MSHFAPRFCLEITLVIDGFFINFAGLDQSRGRRGREDVVDGGGGEALPEQHFGSFLVFL